MQFFTEKLYEVKFTMKNYPYQAIETSFEVPQYVQPVLDFYLPFDHRYSTDTSGIMTPTALGAMQMIKVPSLMEEEYKQKVDIEGWGDMAMNLPDIAPKNAKGFSPITSEDEGEDGNAPSKKPQASANENKSGFDIKNFLSSLNPEAINKFIEEDTNNTTHQPPIPTQSSFIPPPPPGDMRASSHPPSFVYQPPRIHQMPPPLVNSNPQVTIYLTQRPVGMMPHMPVVPSMGMPQYGGIGLPPAITSNRYGPGMRPPNQLPQPYFSGAYPPGMMPHMGVPPPPSGYNMVRPQYMPQKDKKDEQNQWCCLYQLKSYKLYFGLNLKGRCVNFWYCFIEYFWYFGMTDTQATTTQKKVLKLGYFKLRGRAQVPRLLLEFLGIPYEDVLFNTMQDWITYK